MQTDPERIAAGLEPHLKSIEQWAALMRRGQLTQPRAAGRSIASSINAVRKVLENRHEG